MEILISYSNLVRELNPTLRSLSYDILKKLIHVFFQQMKYKMKIFDEEPEISEEIFIDSDEEEDESLPGNFNTYLFNNPLKINPATPEWKIFLFSSSSKVLFLA